MSDKVFHIDWIRANTAYSYFGNPQSTFKEHRATFYDDRRNMRFVGFGDTMPEAEADLIKGMKYHGYKINGLDEPEAQPLKAYAKGGVVGEHIKPIGKEPSAPGYNLVSNKNMGAYDGTIRKMPAPTSSDIATSVMHAHNEEIMKLEQNLRKYISSVSTIGKVEAWAKEKSLDKADPKAQLCKLLEEAGELAEGIIKDRPEQIKDSIGDCVVVLTILALQVGLTIEECTDYAYDQIKQRTGKMVNGVFVKSEDLKEGDDENE